MAVRLARLGLRSAARHAHAAYVASLLGAMGLAGHVHAASEAEGLPAQATLRRALEELNANLLPAARRERSGLASKLGRLRVP